MDLKQIKELMAIMEKTGLKKIRIKQEKGFEIELERHIDGSFVSAARPESSTYFIPASAHPSPQHPREEEKKETGKKGNFVSSPMVGTFYSSPSPEDPAYVKIGDQVEEESIVCIIEAMKVMNEVKAGKKGKIAEILVNNADPVEFGTHLFRIV